VDSLADAEAFSGIVLLSSGARLVFQRAWGKADRETGRSNDLETRSTLGSINKVFSATVVRQLAAEDRLCGGRLLHGGRPAAIHRGVARRARARCSARDLGAAGGAPGLNGVIEEDLPGGYHLVVPANLDPQAAERVARAVGGWLGAGD
jgi:hypothetical protein